MRHAAAFALGLGFAGLTLGVAPASAEYYCSPGFEPTYGGRCVAVLARDEIDLYLNEPAAEAYSHAPVHHRRRHRHGLTARY